jgi:hypothetical protein
MKDKSHISLEEKRIEHPYSVPQGYFDELEQNVLKNTVNAEIEEKRPVRLKVRWVRYLAAASVVLLFGLYIVFKTTGSQDPVKFSSVEESEMLEYSEDLAVSSEDIIEMVSIEDIEWIEQNFEETEEETVEVLGEMDYSDEDLDFSDFDFSEELIDL